MSISALANVFNSVYINIKGIEVLVLSRELAKDPGFMRPKRPSTPLFVNFLPALPYRTMRQSAIT